ncbi:hypothetical protein GCM10020216_083590 [Nonomuraea helvata]
MSLLTSVNCFRLRAPLGRANLSAVGHCPYRDLLAGPAAPREGEALLYALGSREVVEPEGVVRRLPAGVRQLPHQPRPG